MTDRRDLEASLAEMDRKLRELQRELELVGRPQSAPGGEAAPGEEAAGGGPGSAEAASRGIEVEAVVEEAAARVSELGRRIDELAALRTDLDRATEALRAEYRAVRPAPTEVVIDAGPFPDISTLGAFEQALGQVEGVEDAVVRSFEGNRATVDVGVRPGIDLEAALPAELPFSVDVARSEGGGLTLTLRSGV
ncbi:MAG TPA: hypothetical protein VNB64_10415 [Solirubrobacteraceae bacterium]|nr:hypothetical protein [Solirubrobacteraceae bacterium]